MDRQQQQQQQRRRRQSYVILPGRVLTGIFEHLFWISMRDNDMSALRLPLGHRALLSVLSVSHAWRMRAAMLFYRVAVVVAGTGDTSRWAIPTQPTTTTASLVVKTNVGLILDSGYAPKTQQLLVFSTDTTPPVEMAAAVGVSRFCEFVWPSITHLYFYHPTLPPPAASIGSPMEAANDQAIAAINSSLALSMPRLLHVIALSNIRDSFGLFALDDLLIARLSHLRTLTLLSRVSLRLGAEELPRFLTRLTIRSSICATNTSSIVSVPRAAAASLTLLDIGPISPDDLWAPFTSGSTDSDFTNLRDLRLLFCKPRLSLSADTDDDYGSRHHYHRHRLRHRDRRSSCDSTSAGSGWPLFPCLTALAVEGYPYDTTYFLENFPRSQLTRLAIRRCTHQMSNFSLAPFTKLISFNGDVPDYISSDDSSYVEEWVGQTMQADMPMLRSLSLNFGPDIFVELPARLGLHGLQHLALNTGLRMSEVEKILLSFNNLRSLRVTITEVLSRTHEYLSRTTRQHKYLSAEMQERPWLSTSLEDFEVWLLEPSPGRQHRALSKIVYMAMRIPSILRIATQREHVDELRTLCVNLTAVQIREAASQ
ncbi:hypothetical protein GGI21_000118 [Coemansia aciculifera]|nr:hypothetical protein GGI21_000118 [Coemansia aciculifera]